MSEKSIGSKGKPPDKQDVSEGASEVPKEKSGSNVNENASSKNRTEKVEKVEPHKVYEKTKTTDKKLDSKAPMKINGVKNGMPKPSPRREEVGSGRFPTHRSSSRGKTEFRSSTLSVAPTSSHSKTDIKKNGILFFVINAMLTKYLF